MNFQVKRALESATWLVFILKIRVCTEFLRDVAKILLRQCQVSRKKFSIRSGDNKNIWLCTHSLHTVSHTLKPMKH